MSSVALQYRPAAPRQHRASSWAFVEEHSDLMLTLFLLAHMPLAIAMSNYQFVATAHALVVALAALALAARRPEPATVAYAAAYVVGSEVLWRMTHAQTFWEIGKYLIAVMFVLVLMQARRVRTHDLSSLFFLLLLPSAALTLFNVPMHWIRELLSFNLSGPFALAASVWFFHNVRFTRDQLFRLLLATMGPLMAIATITLYFTLQADSITFSDESNYITSGGYGPNQVSAVLGLGSFLAFLYVLSGKPGKWIGGLLFALGCFFSIQSAMTFSRGGLYEAGAALAVAAIALMPDRAARAKLMLIVPAATAIAIFVVVPRLNEFTGGALADRYEDSDLTHRDSLVLADIEIWRENPVFGVGPGMARPLRGNAPHTEFSRLLSEHGLFGLVSLLLLLVMALEAFRRGQDARQRALALSMVTWSFLFMAAYAMRVAAPSFFFGLSFLQIVPELRYRAA